MRNLINEISIDGKISYLSKRSYARFKNKTNPYSARFLLQYRCIKNRKKKNIKVPGKFRRLSTSNCSPMKLRDYIREFFNSSLYLPITISDIITSYSIFGMRKCLYWQDNEYCQPYYLGLDCHSDKHLKIIISAQSWFRWCFVNGILKFPIQSNTILRYLIFTFAINDDVDLLNIYHKFGLERQDLIKVLKGHLPCFVVFFKGKNLAQILMDPHGPWRLKWCKCSITESFGIFRNLSCNRIKLGKNSEFYSLRETEMLPLVKLWIESANIRIN